MSLDGLANVLRDLPRTGTLVSDDPNRRLWRIDVAGRPYYLHFLPARLWRPSAALAEFRRLQWLQRAGVPAVRPTATFMGLNIDGRRGDGLLVTGVEPSRTLADILTEARLAGRQPPDHRQLVLAVVRLLAALKASGLAVPRITAGDILVHDARALLLHARRVRRRQPRLADLEDLAADCDPFLSRADVLRAWRALGSQAPPPPAARAMWCRRLHQARLGIVALKVGAWSGHCYTGTDRPQRWSAASRMTIPRQQWERAWPLLLTQIEADQLEVLKRDDGGDVLGASVVLDGRPLDVIVKRPRRKFWYRYLNEIGRGTRASRAWEKAWRLVARGIPTAWPLLLMQRRRLGYAVDAVLVCERIPGATLSCIDWAALEPDEARRLLWRCGRLLRLLEQRGLSLYDAKATNWMVRDDPVQGLTPMLIDVDGIRLINRGGGLARLLRSLRQSPHFSDDLACHLARGYAPFADRQRIHELAQVSRPPRDEQGHVRWSAGEGRP